MFIVHGEDPLGGIDLLPGEFSTLQEAMAKLSGATLFIERSFQLSGRTTKLLIGTNWMGIQDLGTGCVWKVVAVGSSETPDHKEY